MKKITRFVGSIGCQGRSINMSNDVLNDACRGNWQQTDVIEEMTDFL